MTEAVSAAVLPSILFLTALVVLFSDKSSFDFFLSGAADGVRSAVGLLPSLCALIVAVEMLFASGFAEFAADALSGILGAVGLPSEIVPLLITRPISGSASTAAYTELIDKYGPDSMAVLIASVIMGSSDTVIYVISVYFSAVNIKKTRHAMAAALLTMLFSIFLSSVICRLFF